MSGGKAPLTPAEEWRAVVMATAAVVVTPSCEQWCRWHADVRAVRPAAESSKRMEIQRIHHVSAYLFASLTELAHLNQRRHSYTRVV